MYANMKDTEILTATMSSSTTSNTLSLGGRAVIGVVISTALSNATLTLHGSVDGTNFFALKEKDGTTVAITTATTTGFYKISPSLTDGVPHLRLVSGGSETVSVSVIAVNYK